MSSDAQVKSQLDLAAYKFASILIVIGLLLDFAAGQLIGSHKWLSDLTSELGALLIATGAVSFFWELKGKRALTREALQLAGISESLSSSGISHAGLDYQTQSIWSSLPQQSSLTVVGVHPNSWRNLHHQELRQIAASQSRTLTLILPDPSNSHCVTEVAQRETRTVQDVQRTINECIDNFRDIFSQSPQQLKIVYTSRVPTYAAYLTKNDIVVTLTPLPAGKNPNLPVFKFQAHSVMYEWFASDIERLGSDHASHS